MKQFTILIILCAALCSCSENVSENFTTEAAQLSIVNWNLQTFFDANKDGCEYKEFQKSTDWNTQSYKARLERLCEFITKTDADIYVFEELENQGIIYDLSNELSGKGHNWNQKKFWNYSVFAKEEGSAIGIGILSRYALNNVKTHSMDIRIHSTSQPSTRYILEAQINLEKTKLTILANHWKSKSGGELETEIWRDWQESILAKRINQLLSEDDAAVFICGDFNRDAKDFIQDNGTILRYADFGYCDYVQVNSLWFTPSGDYAFPKGSYFYDDTWERIDNIMLCGNVQKVLFSPLAVSPWASEEGYPISYKIYSGQGWSDHLPVSATVQVPCE